MKRILSFLLCLFLCINFAGCTSNDNTESAPTMQVGYARADISPTFKVQLQGYFSPTNRWGDNILDPLYATCMAFTDADGNTALIFSVDLCTPEGTVIPFARKAIAKATGIDVDSIMISCTHTHSAPDVTSTHEIMLKYFDFLEEQLVKAAQDALADRKIAQMYTTSTVLDNMNFIRHYRLSDGTTGGSNFGDFDNNTIIKHEQDPDNIMQLVRFTREGSKDIIMVNWQVHPLRTGGDVLPDVSADLVGAMRLALEPMMNCQMIYFTGASGDVNPTSQISSENVNLDYMQQGELMAKEAAMACDDMVKQDTGKVQVLRRDQEVGCTGGSKKILTYAISVGDLAFAVASYEMFTANGVYIKENSPFDMTFILTCANTSNRYMPAEHAYNYKGEQAYEVGNGGFEKGVAEIVANGFVEMLTELHNNK